MDTTDPAPGVPAVAAHLAATPRTMPHHRMVQAWRAGLAEPVSAEIISYVRFDGSWWHRWAGQWESIPDGSLAEALTDGHARLTRTCSDTATSGGRGRDPWTVARNRRRTGIACRRPEALLPMRATELRPVPPAVCHQRPPR